MLLSTLWPLRAVAARVTALLPAALLAGPTRLLALLALLLPALIYAQAPGWSGAVPGSLTQANGISQARAVATDMLGNVFVTGYFNGSVSFGSTLLTSQGGQDLFVAKYVPATGTWAWAQSGGGTDSDVGLGIAVSNTSVYVTGYIFNTTTNDNAVLFGGTGTVPGTATVNGASSSAGPDVLLAKYTDNGSSATLAWTQVAGGGGIDQGTAVAVSGSSVYVTGSLTNDITNSNAVLFGGTGTSAGTAPQYGASANNSLDLMLAKYTDNGSTGTFNWSEVGGGTSFDQSLGVAVSGTSVYVTGYLTNTSTNANAVVFGGTGTSAGTAPQYGASNNGQDLVLAKYTDNGSTGTFGWTQLGGGGNQDRGLAVAASGSSVYVTGYLSNNTSDVFAVRFGGSGATAGTVPVRGTSSGGLAPDLLLVKYTDNGSSATYRWAQVGGGALTDQGTGVAVSGTSVYVTGIISNDAANSNGVLFGGDGTNAGTVQVNGASTMGNRDLLLAKYTDQGSSATYQWAQVGGGGFADQGLGVAVSGTSVYVAGLVGPDQTVRFGAATNSPLLGTTDTRAVLTQAIDAGSTGSWVSVAAAANGGTSTTRAVTTDALGNVFVTGYFSGTVDFGSTRLSSVGNQDLFVAKYMPATGTWAWAQSGGGTGDDQGLGIAVSNTSVYVTGFVNNSTTNDNAVLFGGTGTVPGTVLQYGASTVLSNDVLLAKYQDNGTSATLAWTQVGGGTGDDRGQGVAAANGRVYVTGFITNNLNNARGVLFGGSGTTAGTAQVNGVRLPVSNDLVLAAYTDNGPSATLGWTQVGGGEDSDQGLGVAVTSNRVYVTGFINNSLSNSGGVFFGGDGTTAGSVPVAGASTTFSQDLLLVKYLDNGSSAAVGWTQVGGGTSADLGAAVAVSGSNLYVTGTLTNNQANANGVLFGGAGTVQVNGATTSISQDVLLAKYTDMGNNGLLRWTQVGGGTSADQGQGVAVSGTSVFVTGYLNNTSGNANGALFGGGGTTAGTVAVNGASANGTQDVLLAKYLDQGGTASFQWGQTGGGPSDEQGLSVAVSGQQLYAAGYAVPVATFGPTTLSTPTGNQLNVLARATDATLTPLPVQLTAFTATAAGPTAVRLAWATASEVNSAYFAVERSRDGLAWQPLGRVVAAGSSLARREYSYLDNAAPTGTSYYRLRQVDADGTPTYSGVRTVALAGAGTLALYPNPAAGAATLSGATPGERVQVLDALGRVVATAEADATGTAALPAGLPAGVYVVRAGSGAVRLMVR